MVGCAPGLGWGRWIVVARRWHRSDKGRRRLRARRADRRRDAKLYILWFWYWRRRADVLYEVGPLVIVVIDSFINGLRISNR